MAWAVVAGTAAVASGVVSAKGSMASAKAARQVGEYNAKVAENEKVLLQRATRQKEKNLRRQSEKLVGSQRVATAKSGIQMSGSPMQALADTFFNTEMDAINIRYSGSIEEASKVNEAAMARASAAAKSMQYKTQAYSTLLSSGGKAASAQR
jgi:hypothetical protein|tara:strand:- start:1331 stop:1786 length:456 start_codon:yes stop_codon:yes gene_type:complete